MPILSSRLSGSLIWSIWTNAWNNDRVDLHGQTMVLVSDWVDAGVLWVVIPPLIALITLSPPAPWHATRSTSGGCLAERQSCPAC